MAQWRDLKELLEQQGAGVHGLTPVEGLPDLVFTANAAMIDRRVAVLSHFRHPQRQGEEPYNEAWLSQHGFEVRRPPPDLYFEGAGDALFCGETLFAGYRIRSDIRGHQQIGRELGRRVIPLELIDPYYYHLDTCFCPLAAGVAVWFPPAFDEYGRRAIESLIPELIPVEEFEARTFACNAVVVGRTVITNSGCSAPAPPTGRSRLRPPGNAARRVRQSRRQRQVPDAASGRRRSGALETARSCFSMTYGPGCAAWTSGPEGISPAESWSSASASASWRTSANSCRALK